MEFNKAYTVHHQTEVYAVVDTTERTIITCKDMRNAEHYATLLNKAYNAGYKQGYADGKRSHITPE